MHDDDDMKAARERAYAQRAAEHRRRMDALYRERNDNPTRP